MPVIEINTRTGERAHKLDMYYHWQGQHNAPVIAWIPGVGQDHLAWIARHKRKRVPNPRHLPRVFENEGDLLAWK